MGPATCLVGKNESGKSAILEALNKLNPLDPKDGKFDDVEEYPRFQLSDYQDAVKKDQANAFNDVLVTVWDLTREDREAVKARLGIDPLSDSKLVLAKGYSNVLKWTLSLNEAAMVTYYVGEAGLFQEETEALAGIDRIEDLAKALRAVEKPSDRQKALLTRLQTLFPKNDVLPAVEEVLGKRLPKTLYFGRLSPNAGAGRTVADYGEQSEP